MAAACDLPRCRQLRNIVEMSVLSLCSGSAINGRRYALRPLPDRLLTAYRRALARPCSTGFTRVITEVVSYCASKIPIGCARPIRLLRLFLTGCAGLVSTGTQT